MAHTEERRTRYISVCGPIATGKTSLTRIISETFSWLPIYEDLSLNPYFTDYYQDNKRWAFHVVISFLVNALDMQTVIRDKLSMISVCQDWFFAEHHEIYSHHVLEQGTIDKRDFDICERLHQQLMTNAVLPDLVIYLDAHPSTILSRIEQRQREGEAGKVSAEYVSRLSQRYREWIGSLSIPRLEIDTDKYDFVNDEIHQKRVINQIAKSMDRGHGRLC